ncbi:MAG: plant virulence effector HPE1-like domain-containing protein [Allorhizobium sp.]
MRFLLTSALILASGTAFASSITPVTNHGGNGSMVSKSCADCPPLKPKDVAAGYQVPTLAPGSQKTEIVEINGEKKMLRTEAWSGGSPVVYVSKARDWTSGSGSALAGTAGDGVDHGATVGAVHPNVTALGLEDEPAPIDFSALELRLD